MARKPNRYLQENEGENQVYFLAGVYLRLSVDSIVTDSDSISNQRELYKQYLKEHKDIKLVGEYIDDGETGTKFARPGFDKMMEHLKQGLINCVIVKDLSRFGRNHVEAGNYIEKIFPFMQVRFISILDHYDSKDPNCDQEQLLISLKNLMHEMYARDVSQKVKSSIGVKQKKGVFYRTARIPYGYKMGDDGLYIPDEKVQIFVKEMFHYASQGKTMQFVCRYLNDKRISPPALYLKTGLEFQEEDKRISPWYGRTVKKLLSNEVYIGTMIRHQYSQSFYENIPPHLLPESEWIRIPDTHTPLIDKEQFYKVKGFLEKRENIPKKRYQNVGSDLGSSVFSGILFCGNCKKPMVRGNNYISSNKKAIRYKVFQCSSYKFHPDSCIPKTITEDKLCDLISACITDRLSLIENIWNIVMYKNGILFEEKKLSHERKLKQLSRRIRQLEADNMRLYECYSNNDISRDTYTQTKSNNARQVKFLKVREAEMLEKKRIIENLEKSSAKMFKDWLKHKGHCGLTIEMLNTFVDKIEVYPDKKVEITLKCKDVLEELLALILAEKSEVEYK
ncbi:recombinase family protein [Lachnospiraceae bacterium OttesenSCG-928-D06]|nr:recombinase family protein [Lachnospiraceae bacterium OttesenSCG-928-D06]